jgi:hypothetical protein
MDASCPIKFRKIADYDLVEVAVLLSKGLGYSKSYFLQVLERLKLHPTPIGFPKYGYVLTSDGSIVGAILLIFSTIQTGGASAIRCHVTSWYVEPKYRCYATMFFSSALKHRDVSYMNTSARAAALPIIKVQGFLKYSNGQFVTIPLLNRLSALADDRVEVIGADAIPTGRYEPFERELLLTHEKYGNISFWCTLGGLACPFIFQKRSFKGVLPGVQLVYCRDVEDFVRFVRPIGMALASRGIFFVRIDSNGPISGLAGMYFRGMEPRYYKGQKPRLGDLTYTQTVMCPHVRKPNKATITFRALTNKLRREHLL